MSFEYFSGGEDKVSVRRSDQSDYSSEGYQILPLFKFSSDYDNPADLSFLTRNNKENSPLSRSRMSFVNSQVYDNEGINSNAWKPGDKNE